MLFVSHNYIITRLFDFFLTKTIQNKENTIVKLFKNLNMKELLVKKKTLLP